MVKTRVKKQRTPKKPRNYAATDGTWINVRAANKRLDDLERRVTALEDDSPGDVYTAKNDNES